MIRNQFTFYRSYYDAILGLRKRDRSDIILAVCAYALYEEPPECLSPAALAAFLLIKPTLDAGRKKAEAGKLGGSKTQANAKQSASEGEKEREKEKEVEKEKEIEVEVEGCAAKCRDLTATAANKKLQLFHGELGKGVVMLSQEQVEDLLEKLDLDAFDFYVAKLANFIIKNDAKVKGHYETILKWWRHDSELERSTK